jgi:hypothetical protein
MSIADSISTWWIRGVTMRCILVKGIMRDTQAVIAVATTVATPMNSHSYCQTPTITFSQFSGRCWLTTDPPDSLQDA